MAAQDRAQIDGSTNDGCMLLRNGEESSGEAFGEARGEGDAEEGEWPPCHRHSSEFYTLVDQWVLCRDRTENIPPE